MAVRDNAFHCGDHESSEKEADMRVSVTVAVLTIAVVTLAAAGAVQARDEAGGGVCYVTTKTRYPGDSAQASDIAKWMAAGAAAAGLPRELPVMASLVESGVKNAPSRDADSVGYFQMRVAAWNKGEYAGYPSRPDLQLKWFIDRAILFKGLRFSSGQTNLLEDPSGWGEWIADVENVQRPGRQYQLRLKRARALIAPR